MDKKLLDQLAEKFDLDEQMNGLAQACAQLLRPFFERWAENL